MHVDECLLKREKVVMRKAAVGAAIMVMLLLAHWRKVALAWLETAVLKTTV